MTTIDLLIDDARKIAAFGMRAGLLVDTALYAALEKVEAAKAAGGLDWGNPALTELQKATDAAALKIAPVSLVDLNSGWDPFATGRESAASWFERLQAACSRGKLQAACLVATMLLVFVAGYYTLWHARATELMKFTLGDSLAEQETTVRRMLLPLLVAIVPPSAAPEAQETEAAANSQSSTDAVVQTDTTEPDTGGTVDTTRLGLLLEAMAEVQDLQRSIVRYQERFDALYRDRIILWGQLSDFEEYRKKPASTQIDEKMLTADRLTSIGASCKNEHESLVMKAFLRESAGGVRQTAEGLVHVDALRRCFLGALGVPPLIVEQMKSNVMEERLFEFEHALGIVGNWLLPAIYGALGALVYYMRQFVNPLRPDPTASRVMMRVALGALAGILLAWFWTTTTVEEGLTVPDVGLGTLAFAFLLGFSIEVFFGLLDRFVVLANQAVQRLGDGAPAN
jgi:hypothetical protein